MTINKLVPRAWVIYAGVLSFLYIVCRMLEVNFNTLIAFTSLYISIDVMLKLTERKKTAMVLEKTISFSVKRVSDDHYTCKLGDLRKIASGWMVYPLQGSVAGPFESVQDAVTGLVENNLEEES